MLPSPRRLHRSTASTCSAKRSVHFLICLALAALWAVQIYVDRMTTTKPNQQVEGAVISDETMKKLSQAFEECDRNSGKRLNLSGFRLQSLPAKVFEYCDTLELLNMGDNDLQSLPQKFDCFRKLRILFFANNKFQSVPTILGQLPSLFMLSLKSNLVQEVPIESLAPSVEWLILTDNQIRTLPPTIGKLKKLKKCMLAGNQLTVLPKEMSQCKQLELLRISSNNFAAIPDFLLDLPNLTWIAASGNPVFPADTADNEVLANGVPDIPSADLTVLQLLGEGASGYVYRANWRNNQQEDQQVAIKVFKGAVTSDGLPADELSSTLQFAKHSMSRHAGNASISDYPITPILGVISGTSLKMNYSKEELKEALATDELSIQSVVDMPAGGLVMTLIPKKYKLLGNPPSFETITRDTFDPSTPKFSPSEACYIIRDVARAMKEVHDAKLCHGDLYAHNLLVRRADASDENGSPSVSIRLCDFGGATSLGDASPNLSSALRAMELRAFGKLIDDMLTSLISEDKIVFNDTHFAKLDEIRKLTLGGENETPPSLLSLSEISFEEVHRMISQACFDIQR